MLFSFLTKSIFLFLFLPTILFSQPLTGNKTIGPGGDYTTFTAAVTDLNTNGTAAGGVTFLVTPGVYPERFVIDNVIGTGPTSRITFKANGGTVVVRGIGTAATTDVMIRVNATSYITFDSINIEDGGTTSADRVELGYNFVSSATVGCSFIEIKNCYIVLGGGTDPATVQTRGILFTSNATANGGTNNNNLIENVRVDKVAWGIRFAGRALLNGTPTFPDTNNVIRNCILGSTERIGHAAGSSSLAISSSSNVGLLIENNIIDSVYVTNSAPIVPINTSAISLDNVSGTIRNNQIRFVRFEGTGGSLASGVRASIILNDTLNIYNNFMTGISRNPYIPGNLDNSMYAIGIWLIKQAGGGGLARVSYNTIYMVSPHDVAFTTSPYYLSGGSSGQFPSEVKNNIFINTVNSTNPGENQRSYAIVDGNTARTYLLSDYNLLRVTGTNSSIGQIGRELSGTGTVLNTLADWQTGSTQDANSVSKVVNFVNVNSGDLHLTGASVGDLDLAGTPIAGITTDIDGDLRDADFPYMGADEGNIPLPVDFVYFNATVENRDVQLRWATAWEENNDRFEIYRKSLSNDGNWLLAGTIAGSGTSYEMKNYSFTDKNLVTGSYEYKIVQYDFNGNSSADNQLNQIVEIGIPGSFALSQNYPNPFNPVTKIGFEIPVEGLVKITVYDITGRQITTIVNEVLTPGFYTTDFNGASLSSGIYFYSLTTTNGTITKRMTLLK